MIDTSSIHWQSCDNQKCPKVLPNASRGQKSPWLWVTKVMNTEHLASHCHQVSTHQVGAQILFPASHLCFKETDQLHSIISKTLSSNSASESVCKLEGAVRMEAVHYRGRRVPRMKWLSPHSNYHQRGISLATNRPHPHPGFSNKMRVHQL